MSKLVNIIIDDQQFSVQPGSSIIEVADANGIAIPRFCYHKKLSVAANCRMCLVEVENAPKPLPACATPVSEGMKIQTKSKKAREFQKSVMEFLLINHPLDCPICDQGGECDLQDLAVSYGSDFSRFSEPKRVVKDKNLGPLIATDMTRCIHCTRCVRYGKEITGVVQLGGLGRGEHMEIGTFVEQSLSSELSGNIIDLCPVGALTSKPFRFQARNWELTNTPSIAPHDALGSNITIQSINNKIVRVLPRENEAINEIWLSDRDRFSYLGLYTEDRLSQPMVRNKKGLLEPTSWQIAFDVIVAKITEILEQDGETSLGAIMSPNSTLEEFYLAYKLFSGLGEKKLTCRLAHENKLPVVSDINCKISDIDNMQSILLVDSDIQQEIPMLGLRVKKAQDAGATVHVVNSRNDKFSFETNSYSQSTEDMLACLEKVLQDLKNNKANNEIAKSLSKAKNSIVIIGQRACISKDFELVYAQAFKIAQLTNSKLAIIDTGANTKGAMVAGLYDNELQTVKEIIKSSSALIIYGSEVSRDSGIDFNDSLSNVSFILACSPYLSNEINNHADMVLPIANFGETSGTFVNMQNDWQSFEAATRPFGEARPGWKVLRVLANMFKLNGFEYNSTQEILQECRANNTKVNLHQVDENVSLTPLNMSDSKDNIDIYNVDSLVRRSVPLQATKDEIN